MAGGLELALGRRRLEEVFPARWVRRALPIDSSVDDPEAEIRRWVTANIRCDERAGIKSRQRFAGVPPSVVAKLVEIHERYPPW